MEDLQIDEVASLNPSATEGRKIEFLRCPNCKLAVRSDDLNHAEECHGRKKYGGASQESNERKLDVLDNSVDAKWSSTSLNPNRQKTKRRRAKRKADAKMEKSRPSIQSSWNTDNALNIKPRIIPVPFESSRKKH